MIIRERYTNTDLPRDFLKVVVDVGRKIIAVGCELHIDCAEELTVDGSSGKNLWGANVYLDKKDIQFVSLINIRPKEGNRSMEIELLDVQEKVRAIIMALLL